MGNIGSPLLPADRRLIGRAQEALRHGYWAERCTVASAVRTGSGRVYTSVNLNGIHSPCAEPVALARAVQAGERKVRLMVAVHRSAAGPEVLSPCGNCRQLLWDYFPEASVILRYPNGALRRVTIEEALPGACETFEEERERRSSAKRPSQGRRRGLSGSIRGM
jgi:cytidine deaminase